MRPVHPGRVLRRELETRKLSANALALALRTPSGRITDILNGKRGVSPETAMRLPATLATARGSGSTCRRRMNWRSPRPNSASESRPKSRRQPLDPTLFGCGGEARPKGGAGRRGRRG